MSSVRKFLLCLFGAKIGKGCLLKHDISVKCPWFLDVGDNVWFGESVWIDNLDYANHREEIKKAIGVVPQDIALYPSLTAKENLRFFGNMYGISGNDLEQRMNSFLENFELAEHANKRILKMSEENKPIQIELEKGIKHYIFYEDVIFNVLKLGLKCELKVWCVRITVC
jgi:ABC-type uncharacterized transport system YnjBCD ATPase subunit